MTELSGDPRAFRSQLHQARDELLLVIDGARIRPDIREALKQDIAERVSLVEKAHES